jgi:hypothetical protein
LAWPCVAVKEAELTVNATMLLAKILFAVRLSVLREERFAFWRVSEPVLIIVALRVFTIKELPWIVLTVRLFALTVEAVIKDALKEEVLRRVALRVCVRI